MGKELHYLGHLIRLVTLDTFSRWRRLKTPMLRYPLCGEPAALQTLVFLHYAPKIKKAMPCGIAFLLLLRAL